MQTETKKEQGLILDKGLIKGRWKLTYKTVNRLGPEGFGGRSLDIYTDPVTGKGRFLMDPDGRYIGGYFINNLVTMFDPETDQRHVNIIDWLVGHPEVAIDNANCKLNEGYLKRKDSNPRIFLVNLDYQEVENLEEEDFIDKQVGLVSLDTGSRALSLDKLRWINSYLNIPYRDGKYVNDKNIEKQQLRKHLKSYIRSSIENAKKFEALIVNLQNAKIEYEIQEMVRLQILTISNGTYLYKGNPIGISKESVINHFNNDPDYYVELEKKLYNELNLGK